MSSPLKLSVIKLGWFYALFHYVLQTAWVPLFLLQSPASFPTPFFNSVSGTRHQLFNSFDAANSAITRHSALTRAGIVNLNR